MNLKLLIWTVLLLICTLWPYFADGATSPATRLPRHRLRASLASWLRCASLEYGEYTGVGASRAESRSAPHPVPREACRWTSGALSIELDGIGYHRMQAPGATHPDEEVMRRSALADAQGKCNALFGPGSTLEIVWKPKYREYQEDGGPRVEARYEGSFRCIAGTDDQDYLLARLMAVILHPEQQPRFHPAAVSRLEDHATWAMGFLGERAVPMLVANLDQPRFEIQKHVMSALGNTRTGSPVALDALLGYLDHPREEVREEAAATLSFLAPSPKVNPERLLARLIPYLESDRVERRRLAVQILGGLGARAKSAKPRLWEVVRRHPDDWLPPNAIDALADIGIDPQDLPTVISLYRMPEAHPVLRAELVRLLGEMGTRGKSAVPFLFGILQADYTKYREIFEHSAFLEAVVAIGKIGLTDDETLNARVRDRLEELSRSENRFKKEAGEALAVYQAPQRKAEEQRQERLRAAERDRREEEIAHLAAQAPADAMKSVLPLLADRRVEERVKALDVIERLGAQAAPAKEAVFKVFERFPDQPEPEFITAGSALHAIGVSAQDVPRLTALLQLPGLHPQRRSMLARLLGEQGHAARPAVPVLLEAVSIDLLKLDTETASSRTNPVDGDIVEVVKALGQIGPSDDPAVTRAVEDRLKSIAAYDDEFNVPAWLQESAREALVKMAAAGKR